MQLQYVLTVGNAYGRFLWWFGMAWFYWYASWLLHWLWAHVISILLVRVMVWCLFSAKPVPESLIQGNAFQYVICQMVAMVSIKMRSHKSTKVYHSDNHICWIMKSTSSFETALSFPACYESLHYSISAVGMSATLKHCYETVWTSMRHQSSIWITVNGQLVIELDCG